MLEDHCLLFIAAFLKLYSPKIEYILTLELGFFTSYPWMHEVMGDKKGSVYSGVCWQHCRKRRCTKAL